VFQVCGQPTFGGVRSRRKADLGFSSPYDWHQEVGHGNQASSTSDQGTESLVTDIHERLLTTRHFWKNLPDSVCSQLGAAAFELTNCWNGLSISRFLIFVRWWYIIHNCGLHQFWLFMTWQFLTDDYVTHHGSLSSPVSPLSQNCVVTLFYCLTHAPFPPLSCRRPSFPFVLLTLSLNMLNSNKIKGCILMNF